MLLIPSFSSILEVAKLRGQWKVSSARSPKLSVFLINFFSLPQLFLGARKMFLKEIELLNTRANAFFFFNLRYAHFPSSASVIAGAWRALDFILNRTLASLPVFFLL